MAFSGLTRLDTATGSDLEPLFAARFRLHLRHFRLLSFRYAYTRLGMPSGRTRVRILSIGSEKIDYKLKVPIQDLLNRSSVHHRAQRAEYLSYPEY